MMYPAKKDFGTGCAFILFILVVFGFGIFEILTEAEDGGAATIVAGVLVVLTALLWVWFWFGTTYEINPSHVIIRCGPLRSRIGIEEIVEAVPTRSGWRMVGGRHARFALSSDAILIRTSRKWLGFLSYAALISPQDKLRFLETLCGARSRRGLLVVHGYSFRRRDNIGGCVA